jgi:hypothetical protein
MKANNIEKLPAFLFSTNKLNDKNYEILPYLKETPSGMYALSVPATYDPYNEVCDNGIDDNGDSLVDCADPKCSKDLKCAPKVEKPVADLYVMSYCPY